VGTVGLSAKSSGRVSLPGVRPAIFDGSSRKDVSVQFYGMLRGCCSLSNVSTQFARQLIQRFEGAALHSYTGRPYFDGRIEGRAGIDRSAPIGVFHGVPEAVPPFFFDHKTTIGAFVCETNEIPGRWVRRCNCFDLILVPSRFCRSVFQRSGVTTPIALAPHGLEPEYVPKGNPSRDDRFVFYDVARSAYQHRKSCEELIRSFVRAFQGRRDVLLRLRTERTPAIRGWLDTYRAGDLIEIDETKGCSTAEFAAIYSQVHCTVHPARAEGFGLIPFQSIACETPVIAPRVTGMADYLDTRNAMLLRTKGMGDQADLYHPGNATSEADEDHLVELLRHAESRWELEKSRARDVGPGFRARHTWERALGKVMTLIGELVESARAAEKLERINAHCVADGWCGKALVAGGDAGAGLRGA
jgi:glycosyltransferase involved in cell wall biosynthesis